MGPLRVTEIAEARRDDAAVLIDRDRVRAVLSAGEVGQDEPRAAEVRIECGGGRRCATATPPPARQSPTRQMLRRTFLVC